MPHSFLSRWLNRVNGNPAASRRPRLRDRPGRRRAAPLALETLEDRSVPASLSYLVIAHDAAGLPDHLADQVRAAGGTVTGAIPQIGVALAQSDDPAFAANASRIPGVRSVVYDLPLEVDTSARTYPLGAEAQQALQAASAADPDPLSSLQWGLDAIDAPEAWALGATGKGVRVAVLDGGIVSGHPDIAPNLNTALSKSFVPGEPSFEFIPHPANGGFSHSTHVAGIIGGADNDFGIIGVAPDVELVAVKVLTDLVPGGATLPRAFVSQVSQGIVYAADIDTDIINLSLGGGAPRRGFVIDPGTPDDPSDDLVFSARDFNELINVMGRATNYAHQQGTTIIAAAGNAFTNGNKDQDLVVLPRDLPHVISVSATGPQGLGFDPTVSLDSFALYSNFGQSVIDIAAPGGNLTPEVLAFLLDPSLPPPPAVTETCGGIPCFLHDMSFSANSPEFGGFSFGFGTSFAAPHVAGVAALVIGLRGGDMHPSQVRSILLGSADDLGKPGKDALYGHGRVNAFNAVSSVLGGAGAAGGQHALNALTSGGSSGRGNQTNNKDGAATEDTRVAGALGVASPLDDGDLTGQADAGASAGTWDSGDLYGDVPGAARSGRSPLYEDLDTADIDALFSLLLAG